MSGIFEIILVQDLIHQLRLSQIQIVILCPACGSSAHALGIPSGFTGNEERGLYMVVCDCAAPIAQADGQWTAEPKCVEGGSVSCCTPSPSPSPG